MNTITIDVDSTNSVFSVSEVDGNPLCPTSLTTTSDGRQLMPASLLSQLRRNLERSRRH
jgi:hypothetical protein